MKDNIVLTWYQIIYWDLWAIQSQLFAAGVNGWLSVQSCHVCWMTFQVWRGWKAYAIKSWLVYSSIFNKENGLLGYNNSTRISATFLMKVLIHIFVKERFTFVIHHLWRWYVEDWCRENRKSFNQACFFFCLLVFSNCNFFLIFSSPYFFFKILN